MNKGIGILAFCLLLNAVVGIAEDKTPSLVVKGPYIGMNIQKATP